MRHVTILMSFFSIALAALAISMAFYPFLEIGFNSLTNQYPNSKAYILSVMVNHTGNPENFYIVGIDFTTNNAVIVDVPGALNVNGTSLSAIYTKKGVNGVKKLLSRVIGLRFTDHFIFTSSKAEEFERKIRFNLPLNKEEVHKIEYFTTSENKNALQIERILEGLRSHDLLRALSFYPLFLKSFKSTINIPKFLRIANFFESEPQVSIIPYPVINSNGTLKTNKSDLKNLSIELENCILIQKRSSIKVVFVNNSPLSSRAFSYEVWNRWSKKAYDFRTVPLVCAHIPFYDKNLVLEIGNDMWKINEIKKALKAEYPHRKFTFLSLNDKKNRQLYYKIEQRAATNRYYNIGDTDFIVLVGK